MKKIEITPAAYNDLENLKEYLLGEYGEATEKRVLKAMRN